MLNAYKLTQVVEIQAESYLILAKCFHAKEKYNEAYASYSKAAEMNPNLIPAHYGLGQLLLHLGYTSRATECLEMVSNENMKKKKILSNRCSYILFLFSRLLIAIV